jgi:hypothetical protein
LNLLQIRIVMTVKKSLFTGALLAFAVIFSASSCKRCNVAEEDVSSGSIIEDAIVYPHAGYQSGQFGSQSYVVRGPSPTGAYSFEVSFDGGVTKVPVNYSQYSLMAYPMTVNCEASFQREVTFNHAIGAVTYKIDAVTCKSCENMRTIENYVLVPAVPIGYSVLHDINLIEQ